MKWKDDVLAQFETFLMRVSDYEIIQWWMVGWLMDDDCNVGLFQGHYPGIYLKGLTKAVKSLHQGSSYVLADKPSTSKTKVRSSTPGPTCMVMNWRTRISGGGGEEDKEEEEDEQEEEGHAKTSQYSQLSWCQIMHLMNQKRCYLGMTTCLYSD
jgi:hypothetical protein